MSSLLINDMVRNILTSRVYEAALETPLMYAPKLSREVGYQVYLKREDLQPVHSFKIRGAYNKISQLSEEEKQRGIIASSAGNHAQGVALAAQKLGISSLIIMPVTTPSIKVEAVAGYGAEIELHGDSYSEAAEYCTIRQRETGRTFIHSFDDPLVIAGQGTVGKEIIEQLPNVTHVFVGVGGGGLIAGIASCLKALRPDVRVVSVEPEDSNCLQASIAAGERVELTHVGIFADGVAVRKVGSLAFDIAREMVDDFITVTTDQVCSAIKSTFEDTRSILEPAGALALAGMKKYCLPPDARAVVICSGANITFERLQQVAERTLTGSGKEALLSVSMPERSGALHQFCTQVIGERSIREFSYRLGDPASANVLIGIGVTGESDRKLLLEKISDAGFHFCDLTDNDIAKEHVRHMVGGFAPAAGNEVFYEIEFPERSGALGDFLTALKDRWNISLFHYRNAASDTAKVLIGFQTDRTEELEQALDASGYSRTNVSNDISMKLYVSHGGIRQQHQK